MGEGENHDQSNNADKAARETIDLATGRGDWTLAPNLPYTNGSKPDSLRKSRTFGRILPEGSRVERLYDDTRTHVEHGEKSWTTGQTVRDILQNHLDANTQQFFDRLVSTVIDVNKLSERIPISGDRFDEFTYSLYLFRKGLGSFSPDAEKEMVELLNSYRYVAPIKRELLDEQGNFKLDALKQAITPVVETPPKVTYQVKDANTATGQNGEQWLTYEELQKSQFSERTGATPEGDFRYQIVGMKIEDQGSGFDAKLSAFYMSTKQLQPHLRGRFGEGAKMSVTHLLRNGANVKMRSRYEINKVKPAYQRVWHHRASLGIKDTLQQKGIQVYLPPGLESNAGSFTLITIDRADPTFQHDFRANVDPRIQGGGLAQNCLEYSSGKYYYPMSVNGKKLLGVSLEALADNQYVQGLRVISAANGDQEVTPLFSYDFLDSSILKGRDRSELNKEDMERQIYNLWTHADSRVLVSELIRRVATGNYSGITPPEAKVLDRILAGGYNDTEIRKDTQEGRTTMYALEAFPAIVNAKKGIKNVVVKADDDKNKDFIAILLSRGYNIITLKPVISQKSIDNLNQVHEESYQFYSLDTAQKELQSTRNEMDQNDERVKLSQELFNAAYTDLGAIAEKAGFNIGDFSIDTTLQFDEVIDDTKETPFGLDFDEGTKKFRLIIRPELLAEAAKAVGGREYWKRRIQVELLATYKRNEKFPDQNTLYIASQNTTQQILNNTLHTGLPDVDALPQAFNYEPQVLDTIEAIKRFSNEQENIQEALDGWDIFRSVTTFQTNLAEMEKVAQSFDHIPEPYKQEVKDMMGQRIVVENGMVGYFDYAEDGKDDLMLVRKSIDSLPTVGSIDEKPVYQLGNKLFMPYELPKGSVITKEEVNGGNTYIMYGDQLLDFGKYSFGPYQFRSSLMINSGGFAVKLDRTYPDVEGALKEMKTELESIEIKTPERKTGEGMRFLEGVVETPFPSEYGIDKWNNPVRVFQDIVQNHLDASPTGRVNALYEVQRGRERVWITDQEMTTTDIIVGLSVADNGEGYTPNDLGTVGKSSKKSPLFAGKYGEGQKMIAAAAVRNGLDLRFSSVADYNGARYRWQGVVGTRPVEIVIGGKPTNVDRVVFNVTSNQASVNEEFASSTVLRLPEGAAQNSKVWQEWSQVIDPRVKDEFGDGGLARYVLPMRATNGERIIDMGYMKILLDRPGEVYENGLLVSKEGGTALGYDVPELVTTRERNSFDSTKLSQYIVNAAYTCPDPEYVMALMQQFKERYLTEIVNNPDGTPIREQDINFRRMNSNHFDDFVPAKPFWRQAYNAQLGTYLVYSEKALRSQIRYRTNELTASYTNYDRRQKVIKEIEQAYAAIANVGHIPSDHIIHVRSDTEYAYWSRLFPTVEDYIMDLAEKEVPVSEDITKALETVVSASIGMLVTSQNGLRSTEDGQRVFESIVTGKTPKELDSRALAQAETTMTEQLGYWTKEALQQNPGRVFVAPANAGYLGLATRDRIGFNELLLVRNDLREIAEIAGTARHELIHKIYGLRDYSPEFIMMLLESAKANILNQARLTT
ncbi:hypothetical protein LBMAG33_5880 [Candidatus Levyibacteriota bacterium]|nr:hypothetical protein LBMAG33_5880 [Candidatus Levybacteria bacterium]